MRHAVIYARGMFSNSSQGHFTIVIFSSRGECLSVCPLIAVHNNECKQEPKSSQRLLFQVERELRNFADSQLNYSG